MLPTQNIANEEEEIARTKKAKFDERIEKNKLAEAALNAALADIVPCLDVNQLEQGNWTNSDLDLQLDWHRRHEKQREPGKKKLTIPMKSKVKKKADKLAALREAIERHRTLPGDQAEGLEPSAASAPAFEPVHGAVMDDYGEEYGEDEDDPFV
ncbi:hypothetical protein K474DRAFT_1775804 [Panus rudis PR-1116 ss-1]|nr:hypothetical protein K474DRAFT_1775804 [Panus rudis PR-1116 ss-1]